MSKLSRIIVRKCIEPIKLENVKYECEIRRDKYNNEVEYIINKCNLMLALV